MASIKNIIKNADDPKIREFLSFSIFILKQYGFKVRFVDKKLLSLSRTDGNNKSTGYFCAADKEIVVAADREFIGWFSNVYVHEFGHFVQWLNRTPASVTCDKEKSLEKIYDWIDHKIEMSKAELAHHFSIVKKMEWECEKTTMQIIKVFGLPLDLKSYLRGAKKYIKTYDYVKKHRKWKIINW